MNREIYIDKIYYSLVAVLTTIGFYWMLELNSIYISGVSAAGLLIIILAVINCIREIFNNRIIAVVMTLYVVMALGILVLSGYNIISVCIITAILMLYIVIYRLVTSKWVRITTGLLQLIFIIATYFHINSYMQIPRLLIAVVIILVMNSISELLAFMNISKCQGKSLILIYVIVGGTVMLAPVKNEPYDWHMVVKFISKIETFAVNTMEEIYSYIAKEDNLYKEIGYTENSKTSGGMLQSNNKIQLKVSGDITKNNLYLRGNITNTYDGESWRYSTGSTQTLAYDVDAWMTLYACYYLSENKEDLKQYIDIKSQYVRYNDIRTRALFVPIKTLCIDFGDADSQSQSEGDNFRFRRIKKKGFGYNYVFMDINYSDRTLQNIIKNAADVQYNRETWSSLLGYMMNNYGIKTDIAYSDFIRQVTNSGEEVRKQYTKVWDGMSDEARKLALDIAAGSSTELEKCQKLANYVSRYTYSKNIKIPSDANVVDWFLFESKTGYCVQFSTVLTEMLRSQEIPARLVEGFMINYSTEEEDTTEYPVEGNDAHAWVEVYMDGFGWVRVEPSSGFMVAAISTGNTYDYWELIDGEEDIDTDGYMSVISQPDGETLSDTVNNQDIAEDVYNEGNNRIFIIYILYLTFALAVIIPVLFIIMFLIRKRRVRLSSNPDIIVKDILKKLEKKYRKRNDGETFAEYMNSLCGYMTAQGTAQIVIEDCKEIKNLVEKYSYSVHKLTGEDIRQLKRLQLTIPSVLLRASGEADARA